MHASRGGKTVLLTPIPQEYLLIQTQNGLTHNSRDPFYSLNHPHTQQYMHFYFSQFEMTSCPSGGGRDVNISA